MSGDRASLVGPLVRVGVMHRYRATGWTRSRGMNTPSMHLQTDNGGVRVGRMRMPVNSTGF